MTENHERINELLPWLVNGTLDPVETETVRDHVASCVTCRGELKRLDELRDAVRAAEAPAIDGERALAVLLRDISDEPVVPASAPARRWLPSGPVRWILVGQTAALIVAASLLLSPQRPAERPAPEFRTLATPAPTPTAAAPRVRVLFSEGITEQQIRHLLHEVDGRIVDGPTAMGLYSIELARDPADSAGLQAWIEALRDRPGVRFAEIQGDGAQP